MFELCIFKFGSNIHLENQKIKLKRIKKNINLRNEKKYFYFSN